MTDPTCRKCGEPVEDVMFFDKKERMYKPDAYFCPECNTIYTTDVKRRIEYITEHTHPIIYVSVK